MRTLLRNGHEVTMIEQQRDRFERLEAEFEHQVQQGDATELFVLEKAGIKRPPDLVLALTGDDEDNIVICQLAKEKYGVEKVIARVNDPRNQPHFDLLGISPTVCATSSILGLVEHEVPGARPRSTCSSCARRTSRSSRSRSTSIRPLPERRSRSCGCRKARG